MDNQPVASAPTAPAPQHSQKTLLIVLGILEIPFPLFALYMLLPLLKLQSTLGTNFSSPYVGLVFFIAAFILALIQLLIGLMSYDLKLGKQKTKALIISGIILGVLTIPAIIMLVIMPIYSNLGAIQ